LLHHLFAGFFPQRNVTPLSTSTVGSLMDDNGQPISFLGDANAWLRAPPPIIIVSEFADDVAIVMAPHPNPPPGVIEIQRVVRARPSSPSTGQFGDDAAQYRPIVLPSSSSAGSNDLAAAYDLVGLHGFWNTIRADEAHHVVRAIPSSQFTAGFWAALRTIRPRQPAPEQVYMHEGKYDRDTKRDDDYFP
jgi:hypothetical protein